MEQVALLLVLKEPGVVFLIELLDKAGEGLFQLLGYYGF